MGKNFLEKFQQAGAATGIVPFWGWNSELDFTELARQIGVFREMGFKGFFIHSRVGLNVPYLQKEFFDYVKFCVNEAEKNNLDVWLYDEDRWPSGTAGGIVSRNDKFKMKAMFLENIEKTPQNLAAEKILGFYAVQFTGDKKDITSYRRIDDPKSANPKENEELLVGYWDYMIKREWFNGETYLDTMNKDAVAEFIRVTHEAYKSNIGSRFGRQVKGIFTDEMGYSVTEIGCGVPYTENLPELFYEKYKYSIIDFLPELFYSCDHQVKKSRYDFYNFITELFVNTTSRQMGEWCEKNNLPLTGHIFNEDTLALQHCFNGSAMRFYEYMQIPGVDVLTEHWNLFTAVKQCVSVANQLGREIRLSEVFACTGWDFSLTGHKAIMDWQYILGINFFVPHISLYTLKGEGKRDYPASISFQSPWYKKYRIITDYSARLSLLNEKTADIRDILFIHPIESFWSCVGRNEAFLTDCFSGLHPKETDFMRLSNELLAAHLDYDYGDEDIVSRYGRVDKDRLLIGKAAYRAVLIPEVATIRSSVLLLLEKFVSVGGQVFYFGEIPEFVDACRSSSAKEIYGKFQQVCDENYREMLSAVCRRVSLKDSRNEEIGQLLCRLNGNENHMVLSVNNFGCKFSENIFAEKQVLERNGDCPYVKIEFDCAINGEVYEFDAVDGTVGKVHFKRNNSTYIIECSIGALEMKTFVVSENKLPVPECGNIPVSDLKEKYSIHSWDLRLEDFNVLVLDHAKLKVENNIINDRMYILDIDDFLRDKLGIQRRKDAMRQPYCRSWNSDKTTTFELEYGFDCLLQKSQELFLGIESPERFEIFFNGTEISNQAVSWWTDPAISCVKLPQGNLRYGKNILTVRGEYDCSYAGVESLYLLGGFGVKDDVIVPMADKSVCGDLTEQLLPYYSGNVICETAIPPLSDGKHLYMGLPRWNGSALGVVINDSKEIDATFCKGVLDITSYLKNDGENRIRIILYGHRRNSFGPFYLRTPKPFWTDCAVFRKLETANRNLVPFGLADAVKFFED